jgi:hypothetical protein
MTTPEIAEVIAYASESEARALWTHMQTNDNFVICRVRIGPMTRPAEKPVAWIIMSRGSLESMTRDQ